MSLLETSPPTPNAEKTLLDFPLHPEGAEEFSVPLAQSPPDPSLDDSPAAALSRRAAALAADAAMVVLVWAAALLVAVGLRGADPTPMMLAWSAAFWVLLWLCSTIPALLLFGKTVGMAVVGLTARPVSGRRRLTAPEAARRCLGTIATAASLGLALLWTFRRADALTPADRLSARPLIEDEPS